MSLTSGVLASDARFEHVFIDLRIDDGRLRSASVIELKVLPRWKSVPPALKALLPPKG